MTDTAAADDAGEATPALLADLRRLRVLAGEPSYAVVARRAGFGRSTVHGALTGDRLPTQELTVAVARALGGDPDEWRERWTRARVEQAEGDTGADPVGRGSRGSRGSRRSRRSRRGVLLGATGAVAAVVVVAVLALRHEGDAPQRDGPTTAACTTVRTYRATDSGNVLDAAGTVVGSLTAGATVEVPDTADRGPFQNRYAATVHGATTVQGYVDIAKLDLLSPACS